MANPSTVEWCADKLSKLLNEDLRVSTLTEIREHFNEISDTEATHTAELLELPVLFDCLNDSNKEQVDLACEVLSMCMEKLDIGETTSRYSIPLERALSHPNSGVKLMALEELSRILQCNPLQKSTLISSLCHQSIFINIVRCMGDKELGVASKAESIVSSFALNNINCLLNSEILKVMKETMETNEVVRLRFYQLFINIAVEDKNLHTQIVNADLIKPMMEEIKTNDVLLRLNIIEMLSLLVCKDYGYLYLQSEGFIDQVFRLFLNEADPIFLQLCEPGILKFYGHLVQNNSKDALKKYPQVLDKVFANLDNPDFTILKVSMETLGFISRGDKVLVDRHLEKHLPQALRTINNRFHNYPTEVKLVALTWIEDLLHMDRESTNESRIAMKWFGYLGDRPLDLVMCYAKNPFEELRAAGLKILLALSNHVWGQDQMKQHPGLEEFLMDRSVEVFKSSKDLKYLIVKNIVDSNLGVFESESLKLFQKYVNEGAHFVAACTEIAVEGNE